MRLGARRTAAALAVLAVLPRPAAAEPVPCTILEAHLAPPIRPAAAVSVQFSEGRVVEVVLRSESGTRSRTLLTPLRPGISARSVMHPWPQEPSRWIATFNLVTVEPAGTVLAETWATYSTQPEAPQFTWMRLACGLKD